MLAIGALTSTSAIMVATEHHTYTPLGAGICQRPSLLMRLTFCDRKLAIVRNFLTLNPIVLDIIY
jgi:hypothetical protein